MKLRVQTGFTVIEVMISLVVAAALLALAAPSFIEFTKNKRITTQANEFVSSLALARSEALKRVSRVTVCSSSTGTSCTGTWSQGYIVFNDDDDDGVVDGGEPILKAVSALPNNWTLDGSTDVASYVSFVSTGHSKLTTGAFQTGTIVLCDDRGAGDHARAITINITGRVRVESTAPDTCTP